MNPAKTKVVFVYGIDVVCSFLDPIFSVYLQMDDNEKRVTDISK